MAIIGLLGGLVGAGLVLAVVKDRLRRHEHRLDSLHMN
jgi:hypothetical protein